MNNQRLPRIEEIPCHCPECAWEGVTGDCEPDIHGDGELGCPMCFFNGLRQEVVIEYP